MARPSNEVSFGAVYEHRVNGVPKFIGSTNMLPEDKFSYNNVLGSNVLASSHPSQLTRLGSNNYTHNTRNRFSGEISVPRKGRIVRFYR
eukprot:7609582-Pyramimonas_sp.AAC.1